MVFELLFPFECGFPNKTTQGIPNSRGTIPTKKMYSPSSLVARKKTGPRSRGETTEVFPAPIIICFTLDLPRFVDMFFLFFLKRMGIAWDWWRFLGKDLFFCLGLPKAVKIVALTLPTWSQCIGELIDHFNLRLAMTRGVGFIEFNELLSRISNPQVPA